MPTIQSDTKVRYRSDPTTAGWVVSVSGDSARVFIDGAMKLVPVSELEVAPGLVELSPAEFRNALTLQRLDHPATDQFLSFKASKTKLLYHQFLPVKKMLESPDQRLLIADEVGTGKTIEAGLIWAELESRSIGGLENVWIVCPKSLVGKWQDEMLQRFDFRLEALTSEGLRQALVSLERDGVMSPRFAKSVVNLELLRMEENAKRLEASALDWGLVIFDEAHHLRNTDTLSNSLADLLCDRADAALFLTATPLQTQLRDIVNLMGTLGVDVAEDPGLLEEQLRWDMQLNDWIRLLKNRPPGWHRDAIEMLGSLESGGGRDRPGWQDFRRLVVNSDLDHSTQRSIAIDSARDLQVLDPYMTRTLRADVDENRPTREAVTRKMDFSDEEDKFYKTVYEICYRRAKARGLPAGFMTQMPERRTASCVPAVAAEILGYSSEDEDEDHVARWAPYEIEELAPLARDALKVEDLKLKELREMLDYAFGELGLDRVMIFSTFRGTLRYLERELQASGHSLALMYGPTPARDTDCRRGEKSRERIAKDFRAGEFQVLLASEVAGEGLDFEHCSFVINYDLPWNPMRVEQRIGRCDRIGQRSEKVYVGNLASVGTIEERILTRLFERLEIFERALGGLEVILGEEISSFERELFTRGLTPQQQIDRLERISHTVENNERNRENVTQLSFISEQGRTLIESEETDIRESEAKFLSSEEIADFVCGSINKQFPHAIRRRHADGSYSLRNGKEISDALRGLMASYPATHYARTEITRFRNQIGESTSTLLSFGEDRENHEFVHPRHPLVLLARNFEHGRDSDTPWCIGEVPAGLVSGNPTMLIWAIGSLDGYARRAELMCATIDSATGNVNPIPVERAQEILRAMKTTDFRTSDMTVDLERQTEIAEQELLDQFNEVTKTFSARNNILVEKAKRSVNSHAERRTNNNNRRLSEPDLNENLRVMFNSSNENIRNGMQAKLDQIDQRGGVKSSLEVIGLAVIHPEEATDSHTPIDVPS